MRHEATRDLFRYWNAIRRERASPERHDLDPAAIRHILADTFLIEAGTDGRFRLRLSGTRLDALWLADLKDRNFADLWGEDRSPVAAALWTVMDGAAPVIIGARVGPPGRPQAEAEVLLLPMRHHGKTHSLILGALTLAEPPAWIGLVPAERLHLVSLRIVTPERGETPVIPLAVRQKPVAADKPVRRWGHLTVYPGGKDNADHERVTRP